MKRHVLLWAIVVVCSNLQTNAAEFRAAAAKTDVTPADSQQLWGYFDRKGPSTGKLDPLMAKILVVEAGEERIAIVTLDLGRTFGPPSMQQVRDRVAQSADVDQVFFSASHTHSGPVIEDDYGENGTPRWEQAALENITSAIEGAATRLEPAQIGTGYGETYIGHNRRYVQPDGKVKMLWRNASKIPTQPVDPRVGVIRIDDADGQAIAVLVNYSCHPVVLGPDNLEYSADWSGAMQHHVESQMEGGPVCLFLQGGAGDINPYYDKMALSEDGARLMQETGAQVGAEVVRVSGEIETSSPQTPSLRYSLDTITFAMRWDMETILERMKPSLTPYVYTRYKRYLTSPLECPVMSLVINDRIALMGMPGEPFVEFAINFRDRSPYPDSFFVGYANGYKAYFPTIKAAVEGGYGANSVSARAEVGAGEKMVDHAVVKLYELKGKLTNLPGF